MGLCLSNQIKENFSMLIQLQLPQVSIFWDQIKHGVLQSNEIPEDQREHYANNILTKLLSGQFQAWMCFTGEDTRKIHAIGITTLLQDNLYGYNRLHGLSLYGYRTLTEELALDAVRVLQEYAKNNSCEMFTLDTSIPRVAELAKLGGMRSTITRYSITI